MGFAEAQVLRAGGVGRKPFVIDVEHEEDPAIRRIPRQEVVRLPRADRDDAVFDQLPAPIAHVDLRRRSADMEDQVSLAVRMHVKGTIQLINRRATEPAVKDSKRFAHALPPAALFNQPSTSGRRIQGREGSPVATTLPATAGSHPQKIRQYFLHSGTVRLGSPIFENTAGS